MARTGRPPVGERFQRIRMSHEQQDELALFAAVLGVSRAEVVRRALAAGLAQMKKDVAA